MRQQNLAAWIDHSVLKETATEEEVEKACKEAIEYGFKAVCVRLSHLPLVVRLLEKQKSLPIAVIDFPLGESLTETKVKEAKKAIALGAKEIDTILSRKDLKAKDYRMVFQDIAKVVESAKPCLVKVILETGELTLEEKIISCALAKAAGAAFVKTSTGFGKGGATVEDIVLMRKIVGKDVGVKASGGIRTFEDAQKMIDAGADRLGTSASVAIVMQSRKNLTNSY